MSLYKDIIVIKEKKETSFSPEITGDIICELLAHKNRAISGVKKIDMNEKNLEECIGKYCSIMSNNTIIFSFKHYNSVFFPLWRDFQAKIQNFNFKDFTSEKGLLSLLVSFENIYSPNIIYCVDNDIYGFSLEDFFRSEYFSTEKEFEILSLWCHHE